MTHIFAVVAYKDSPYLEACLKSLAAQSVPSQIVIYTSTPSEYIDALAGKYDVEVRVRDGESGISEDWNYAYDETDADLITIAHQDDMYQRDYTKTLLEMKEKYPDMSLFTTASVTVKDGKLMEWGSVELVKKLLRIPLRINACNDKSYIKKAALVLGNPIICPSCTYDKKLCGDSIFSSKYKFVLDWDVLLKLAEKNGRFVCIEKPLIMYRVHTDAATGECIADHTREKEESEMFDKLLPKPYSDIIKKLYKKSYDAYR